MNSNAAFLGARLAECGFDAHFQQVVGDNSERLVSAIRLAISRAGGVIITGGLGPTQDDLTREAICEATGLPMAHDEGFEEALRLRFAASGREVPVSNYRQADYPEGAELLSNRKGTAPGLWLEFEGKAIAAVPGVPEEMQCLVDDFVIPRLQRFRGTDRALVNRVIRCWGLPESTIAEMLDDLFRATTNPSVAFLASAAEVKVRLTASAPTENDARSLIVPVEAEVLSRLGEAVFGFDGDSIEEVVLDMAREKGWSLGTAESATGGIISGRLTSVPGASEVFRGSVVTYATDLKERLLDVEVGEDGVVCEDVAVGMAEGARRLLRADAVVALTGSAGPVPQGQPVGTVIVGVATPEGKKARTFRFSGDRERVRAYGSTAALNCLRLGLKGEWW